MATTIKELWKRDYDAKIAKIKHDQLKKEHDDAEQKVKDSEQAKKLVNEFMRWITYTPAETTDTDGLFDNHYVVCYSSDQSGFPFFVPSLFTSENKIQPNVYVHIVPFLTEALLTEGITVVNIEFVHFGFNRAVSIKIVIQFCNE